jgi:hypothetical protein
MSLATILGWIISAAVFGMFTWLAVMLVTIGPAATNATVARMVATPLSGGSDVMPVREYNQMPSMIIPTQPVVMNTATGEERVVMI